MVYKKKISNTSFSNDGNLVNELVTILNYNYFRITSFLASSKIEEKTKKLANLKEKIYQSKYSNYYSISKSWFNTYIVFKNKCLNNKLEDNPKSKSSKDLKKIYTKNSKELDDKIKIDDKSKIKYDEKNKFIDDIDDYFFEKKNRIKTTLEKKKTIMKKFEDISNIDKNSTLNIDYVNLAYTNNEKLFQDEKNRNKRAIMINIIDLFNLFLKKNQETLILNFIKYYKNNDIKKQRYEDFLHECILPLGFSDISFFIDNFISEDKDMFNVRLEETIFSFDKMYECSADKNLSFVHNLMITFNLSQDLELQNSVLNLMYK